MFFTCITAMVQKKKAKARRRNDSGSKEDGEEFNNIIVAFLTGLCLIGLNMRCRHMENIHLKNFVNF